MKKDTEASAKKKKPEDVRTECTVCKQSGTNANLVRYKSCVLHDVPVGPILFCSLGNHEEHINTCSIQFFCCFVLFAFFILKSVDAEELTDRGRLI